MIVYNIKMKKLNYPKNQRDYMFLAKMVLFFINYPNYIKSTCNVNYNSA